MPYKDEWKKQHAGHDEIRRLHESLRDEVMARWRRSLPFADELFDRWERAAHLGFGADSSIYDSSVVLGDVQVGANTWIGPFTVLDGSGGLSIGSFCNVSAGVQIYSHDTVEATLTGGKAPARSGRVSIGDHTYLGPNAIVSRGVSIGSQCVVGASALVNRDVPDRAIVFGTPGRVVGRVELDADRVRLVYD
jgi:acetyltransferase-like isoleucine patch superfamily enzyme